MKFLMLVSLDPSRDESDTDLTGSLEIEDWVTKYDAAGVRLMEMPLNAEAVYRALCAKANKPLEDA
jgi:hypothetical protein